MTEKEAEAVLPSGGGRGGGDREVVRIGDSGYT